MKSMKTYLVVWLAGLVAGLALMERWQRTTGAQAPARREAGETPSTWMLRQRCRLTSR